MRSGKRRSRAKFHDETELNDDGSQVASGSSIPLSVSDADAVHTEEYHRLPSKRTKVTHTTVHVKNPDSATQNTKSNSTGGSESGEKRNLESVLPNQTKQLP